MKLNKKRTILLVITILCVFFITISITYGKYVYNSIFEYYLESKEFYLSSDYLSINNSKTVNNLWSGENVIFNIKNSNNDFLITPYDIEYSITCTVLGNVSDNVDCVINNSESNIFTGVLSSFSTCVNKSNDELIVSGMSESECMSNGYSWERQISHSDMYFNVIPKNDYVINDVTVNISLTSISPYSKTISGNFVLHKTNKSEKIVLDYKNYSGYDRLIISNSYFINKSITVNWNSNKYRIDLDGETINNTVDSNGYINSITFTLNSNKSTSYIFYKISDENTNIENDFLIS